jgi:hypothetical protein
VVYLLFLNIIYGRVTILIHVISTPLHAVFMLHADFTLPRDNTNEQIHSSC